VLILAKNSKNVEIPKIRISAGSRLYPAGNHMRPIFSGSLDPGDAFCTVARLRNSFSDDSRGFEKFPSENDRKIGDDQYSWKFLGSQNILPATKILFFSGSRLELSLEKKIMSK
tara:strand:- start:77 stop:418 length:342 start_codon:yes stop_codon:yes gene_type:complete